MPRLSFAAALLLVMLMVLSACGSTPQTTAPTVPTARPAQSTAIAQATPTTAPKVQTTAAPTQAPPSAAAPAVQPTVPATPAKPKFNGPPVRVVIEDLNLDDTVVALGLDKQQVPMVDKHHVTWYSLSAKPGRGDNVVLEGHVYRYADSPTIPAPFAHMKELKPGAKLTMFDAAGTSKSYALNRHVAVSPEQIEFILPTGQEMVTAVSCYGEDVIGDNGLVADKTERLISIFLPIEE